MIDHIDLNVSDLARSLAFYEPFLASLGFRPFEDGPGWRSFIDAHGRFYLVLVQSSPDHAHAGFHRKRVGVNHLAFTAASDDAVDRAHAWLVEHGSAILYGGPKRMDRRYAVFFEDPDRLKIEVVHRPA